MLNITAGEYRTRNGVKAVVKEVANDEGIGLIYPAKGYLIDGDGVISDEDWLIGGAWYSEKIGHELDLVAKWSEPAPNTVTLLHTATSAKKAQAKELPDSKNLTILNFYQQCLISAPFTLADAVHHIQARRIVPEVAPVTYENALGTLVEMRHDYAKAMVEYEDMRQVIKAGV